MPKHDQENLDVFEGFLAAKPFEVDVRTARLETPPRPDASCIRDGRRWYFELVRAVNPGHAAYNSELQRTAERSPDGMAAGQACASPIGVGFVEAIEKKATKRYDIGTDPLDLLIWIDGENDQTTAWAWPYVEPEVTVAVETLGERWHTVWIYDPGQGRVLGSIAGPRK